MPKSSTSASHASLTRSPLRPNNTAMAACIGVQDPKWGERPLLIAVRRPQGDVDREQLLAHYTGKVARWQVPDDVVFVDAIPLGATGKMQKHALRERLKDHALPNA